MASPGVGAKGFIGFGPEDTWGTAATITRYIEFLSESVKRNQSGVVSNGIQPTEGLLLIRRQLLLLVGILILKLTQNIYRH